MHTASSAYTGGQRQRMSQSRVMLAMWHVHRKDFHWYADHDTWQRLCVVPAARHNSSQRGWSGLVLGLGGQPGHSDPTRPPTEHSQDLQCTGKLLQEFLIKDGRSVHVFCRPTQCISVTLCYGDVAVCQTVCHVGALCLDNWVDHHATFTRL